MTHSIVETNRKTLKGCKGSPRFRLIPERAPALGSKLTRATLDPLHARWSVYGTPELMLWLLDSKGRTRWQLSDR